MYNASHMFLRIRSLLASLVVFAGILAIVPSAQAATTTVCGLGCDYTTLNDAINAPHVTPDTIVVQVGYAFTFPPESNFFNMPDDLTIMCDGGVIIGDALQTNTFFTVGSRNAFIGCTFDAVNFGAINKTDVSWINNTFTANGQANISLTLTDGFTISGNTGIQQLQIQNADNGIIDGNTLDCYNGVNCIGIETMGGPVNYSDPADVPNDILISNNTITNRYFSSGGDWVHFGAGINIDYVSNTLQSIAMPDNYITMLTVENANVDFNGNFFIFPEKTLGANNQSWGINLRISQADIDVNVENNSFIRPVNTNSTDGISCLGIYDSGMTPGLKTINLTFTHNLCYDVSEGSAGSNRGLTFGYAATSSLVNLTEEYNGFYNFESGNLVQDQNGPHNSGDVTDIIKNPVFRTEDADPSNDFEPAPMSWYFDINGTEDIGAVGGVRETVYTIDDGCVVDYSSCMSQFTSILNDVLKNYDVVTIGDGTYPSISINGPLIGAQIYGIGPTTIFDAQGAGSAIALTNVTNLTLSNISLINSSATYINTYTMTKPILSFGGNDYSNSDAFGAPPNSVFYIPDALCNAEVIQVDGDPVSADGVNNINAVLLNAGPFYITVFVPNNVADDLSDVLAPTFCGGGLPATHFVNNVFTANGNGTYTFNASALALQSISVAAGMTTPPVITLNSSNDKAAGLRLEDVTTSTFASLTFSNNDNGVSFLGNSAGNVIDAAIFIPGAGVDIASESSGTNDLLDTTFDRAGSDITGPGNVRVRYNSIVRVFDSLLAPIEGVAVNFVSANSLTNASSTTNGLGMTANVDSIAYIMTSSSLALTNGGYNPFTITAFGNGIFLTTTTQATLDGVTFFDLVMSVPSIVVPPVSGGGGGLPSVNSNGTYSFFNTSQSTGMVADSRMHQLVKLRDDGNAKTQEDSTVYYIGADGLRHAFPNPDVYGSWYCDFSQVKIIGASDLANYRLGRNVTYRPGLRLVKFPTNPKVYVVQAGHTLRAIKDEVAAIALFGTNWAKQVSDIQDTFYNDYSFGEEVTAMTDKAFLDLSPSYPSGEMGITGYQDITIPGSSMKCSSVPTAPTTQTAAGSWPFATIPKTFSFNADLNSTSGASNDVRYLQEFLASKGKTIYADGRVTGTYGDLTTQAVKNYQKSKGISQTGTVGTMTRSAINKELNALR